MYDYFILGNTSLNQRNFFVSFVKPYLKMSNFMFLDSVGNTNKCSVSLAKGTFGCSSNATTAIRIVYYLYICFSYNFILRQCLHNILSPEMKFHFSHNDRNEVRPVVNFVLLFYCSVLSVQVPIFSSNIYGMIIFWCFLLFL